MVVYDYQMAAKTEMTPNDYSVALLEDAYTKVTYDFRAICKDHGVDATEYYQQTSGPSAKIKLLS